MEHLDKLIPLAILGIVGILLLMLARRSAREKQGLPPIEEPPVAAPLTHLKADEPAILVTLVKTDPPITRRKRVTVAQVSVPVNPTPIETVFELLKSKDSLAAAFVLREILDPPGRRLRLSARSEDSATTALLSER